MDAAGWVDPPGEPLDEQAIKAARAAAISAEVLGAGFWPKNGADPEARPGAGPVLRSRSGFGSGDDVDELEPGPALAGLTDTASRPDRIADLDDDELIGALRAWRRLESWSAAGTLSVVAELARRRPADGTAPANPGQFPDQPSEFLTDEVAFALTLTGPAAGTCLDLALDLAIRLPGTAHALRAGIIDYLRARIIAEATRILSPDDARRVEAVVLAKAGQQTSGQLRAVLARTILAIDPEAAQRRREQAQKDPRIRRWREDAGTAALAGYGLPPADVLEADQHLTERALNLREAGVPGTMDELRARAYLDALLGRDPIQPAELGAASESSPSASTPPSGPDAGSAASGAPASTPPSGPHAGSAASAASGASGAPASTGPSGSPEAAPSAEAALFEAPADPESCASSTGAAPSSPSAGTPPSTDRQPSTDTAPAAKATSSQAPADPEPPAPSASAAPSAEAGPRAAPAAPTGPAGSGGRLAARINVTVPLATLLGPSGGPGDIGGFGPIDAALARDITARAATHPSTSWSLTITHTGHAIAHGPIPARLARRFFTTPSGPGDGGPGDGVPGDGAPGDGVPGDGAPGDGGPGDGGPGDGGPGHRPPGRPRPPARPPGSGDLTVTLTPLARDGCDHCTEEFRYQPGQRLQHLIRARTATCSAPGCRRPAARCDLDHTIPYDHGGRSCECNLAPLCRHHHRTKQAQGWHLEQLAPGIMRWTTPARRRHTTTPTTYY